MAAQQFYKGHAYTMLAVADGHGNPSYSRSEVGAHLAVQAAQSAATRFIPFLVELLEERPTDWRSTAQHEFRSYFGKWLRSEWEALVIWHLSERPQANSATSSGGLKPYGTTLTFLLIFGDLVFAGAIGDSDIYFVQTGETSGVVRAFSEDPSLLGLQAHSLSSRDAHYKWNTRTVSLSNLGMILLGTDGFADSLENPEASVKDMYDKVNAHGIDWLKDVLPGQLQRWSDQGVRDDITVIACFVSSKHPQADQKRNILDEDEKS